MDVLRPFFRIHIDRTYCSFSRYLEDFRLSVARKTILISISLRKRTLIREKEEDNGNKYVLS
jgi:hypothetical protein